MAENRELTDREREILERVATGASNRQIAQQLHISSNTVKVHLRNIFEKLGVSSRTEATLYAIQAGLVEGVESGVVTVERSWWQRGWVIAGGALALTMVALLVGILVNPGESPSENIVDLEQLERERWQELAPMPTARKGLAVTAYDGKIYAIAGETTDGVTDVVERYDPATDTWETLLPKPTAVTDVQAAVIGGKIYVPGGRLDSDDATDIFEVFDPRSGIWERASTIPQELTDYALAAYEGRLFLFGGTDGAGPQPSSWIYSVETDDWVSGEPMPGALKGAGAVAVSGGILVLGGSDGDENRSAVQLYLPERDGTSVTAWSLRAHQPYTGTDLTMVGIGDIVYLFGALDGDRNLLMQEYTFGEDKWQVLALPFETRWMAPGVTQIGNEVFVLGGHIEGEATSQLASYTAFYTVLLPIIQ